MIIILSKYGNILSRRWTRSYEGSEVFYYAHPIDSTKEALLRCIQPASEAIKKDIKDDRIKNLILYVKQGNETDDYDPDEIEELLASN